MHESVVIPERFNGPVGMGQGGYVCGVVSRYIGMEARVTLRAPAPVETPLTIFRNDEGRVVLEHEGKLLAEGEPTTLELDLPDPPSLEEAERAARHYAGFGEFEFDRCFVCGSKREPGDGMRVFPGILPGTDCVASPFVAPGSVTGEDGAVLREVVWGVLDCSGGWALILSYLRPEFPAGTSFLMGRCEAKVAGVPRAGTPAVAHGWPIARDGRRMIGGSALYGDDGKLLAAARVTFFALPARA